MTTAAVDRVLRDPRTTARSARRRSDCLKADDKPPPVVVVAGCDSFPNIFILPLPEAAVSSVGVYLVCVCVSLSGPTKVYPTVAASRKESGKSPSLSLTGSAQERLPGQRRDKSREERVCVWCVCVRRPGTHAI
jgi:hypothetical protein